MNNLEMKIIFVMSQVIHAEDDIETVVDKIRRVQHALEEMERREEEFIREAFQSKKQRNLGISPNW